jgi:uncharacterized membrane protein YsdA (DUF1294 family)
MRYGAGCGIHIFFTIFMIFAFGWIFLYAAELTAYEAWLLAMSVVTFSYYGFDKYQAQRKGWRVPEVWLHVLAFAGGFLGGWAGLFWFRHKTDHFFFMIMLVLATALHIWFLSEGWVSWC